MHIQHTNDGNGDDIDVDEQAITMMMMVMITVAMMMMLIIMTIGHPTCPDPHNLVKKMLIMKTKGDDGSLVTRAYCERLACR